MGKPSNTKRQVNSRLEFLTIDELGRASSSTDENSHDSNSHDSGGLKILFMIQLRGKNSFHDSIKVVDFFSTPFFYSIEFNRCSGRK